jgi:hypothetical protein
MASPTAMATALRQLPGLRHGCTVKKNPFSSHVA